MVKLVNIKKNNDFISSDYIPEASEEKGYIKMDLQGNVVESKLTSCDEIIADYFSHAKQELKRLLKINPIPDHSLVMWY